MCSCETHNKPQPAAAHNFSPGLIHSLNFVITTDHRTSKGGWQRKARTTPTQPPLSSAEYASSWALCSRLNKLTADRLIKCRIHSPNGGVEGAGLLRIEASRAQGFSVRPPACPCLHSKRTGQRPKSTRQIEGLKWRENEANANCCPRVCHAHWQRLISASFKCSNSRKSS